MAIEIYISSFDRKGSKLEGGANSAYWPGSEIGNLKGDGKSVSDYRNLCHVGRYERQLDARGRIGQALRLSFCTGIANATSLEIHCNHGTVAALRNEV